MPVDTKCELQRSNRVFDTIVKYAHLSSFLEGLGWSYFSLLNTVHPGNTCENGTY